MSQTTETLERLLPSVVLQVLGVPLSIAFVIWSMHVLGREEATQRYD